MVYKTKFALSLLILAALLLPQAVLADGMILPFEEEVGYLSVTYHHVTVDIEDTHAVTRVEQAFYNPHDVPVTAHYLFPVPPNAMVTAFEAIFDGERQSVNRQDAAATNAALYDLVARRHDPSLLRYADWETLAFDVTVPAGATREMTLQYEEVLAPTGGLLHYHYVLSTERYSAQPLASASVTVNVAASQGIGTLYSSSHTVTTERRGEGRARVTWEADNVHPTEDFHLFFAPAEAGFGSGLLTGQQPGLPEGERDHLLFLFSPEVATAAIAGIPKDIVFIIDRSGSMGGEKIVQAQQALRYILNRLDDHDRFSIVGFDDRLDVLAPAVQPVTDRMVREATRFVDDLYARDSTDLDAALQRGLEILDASEARAGASRMVVFLTDGLPTAGIEDPTRIAERAGRANRRVEARLHVFGVGYDVNTHLLDRLAAENGGSVTYVQPGENLELVLTDFYNRIAHPVLTDLEIDFEGIRVSDVHPATLPDMFEGSSLLLTGRYQTLGDAEAGDTTVTIRVRGNSGEVARTFIYTFDLAASRSGDTTFVPRLWATRQIGQLLDEVRVEGERAALVEEIRGLGLTYGLVTPYTTFVIAAQTEGAASMDNMALYSRGAELNQAWGETTIQARVQNQSYQLADQAALATGANVVQSGSRNLAQVSSQHIDLTLLQGRRDLDAPIDGDWIAANIEVDRQVAYGSEAYFELADDPEARAFLQAANNVVFTYQGAVIQVTDPDAPESVYEMPEAGNGGDASQQTGPLNTLPFDNRAPQAPARRPVGLIGALVNAIVRQARAIVRGIAR